MRLRVTPFASAIALSALALVVLPAARDHGRTAPPASTPQATAAPALEAVPTPEPSPTPTPSPTRAPGDLRAGPVQLSLKGYWSWALLDRRTGAIAGSANLATRSDTASMVKAWIAADFLRRATERGQKVSTSQQRQLSIMIRDSDNKVASSYHRINGGTSSIKRLAAVCKLTETVPNNVGSWSTTMMSSRDAARMGACIADGRAAGPQWTGWVLNEMRLVRGFGRFGIVEAFPPDVAGTISIKNGWITRSDGYWRVNCLAVAGNWVLAVMTRYPGSLGQRYGATTCKKVAQALSA